MRRKARVKRLGSITVLLSVIVLLGIAAGGGLAWYLFSGRWNVAASDAHFEAVRWAVERVYTASVTRHAGPVPVEFAEASPSDGAALYATHCARCHAAPGGERPDWAVRMRPEPPHLPQDGTEFSAAEVLWLVRHGIKMTGMPAWQGILSEREMLSLAAFVDRLPEVSLDSYERMLEEATPEGRLADQPKSADAARAGDEAAGETEAGAAAPTEEPAATANGAEAAATVEMTNTLNFVPAQMTVSVGDTIRWLNTSDLRHTVTGDEELANDPSHVALPDGAEPFNSGDIPPGASWSHRFTVAGRYRYFCIPHEGAGMIGEVIVKE